MLKHRIVSGNHWPRPAKPTRWICTDEPVTCRRCHIEWLDGDPALSIECPGCCAEAGYPCQRPQGGNERVCFQRDRQAIRDGLLMPCEGLSWDGRHDKRLMMTLHPYPHAIPIMSGAPVSRFSA